MLMLMLFIDGYWLRNSEWAIYRYSLLIALAGRWLKEIQYEIRFYLWGRSELQTFYSKDCK